MNCSMEGCTNTKRSCKNSSIYFFSFPNIPAMRAKWIWACNNSMTDMSKKPFVCSIHFQEKDILIRSDGPPRLNRGAFPLPPEGCARRKTALNLTDCTIFVNTNNGILLLNSDGHMKQSLALSENATSSDNQEESISHKEVLNQYDDSANVDNNFEFIRIERLETEEYITSGPTDEEEIIHLPARSASQYFKCCVWSCRNTSKNSDLKFYKFRTDEFSRSMWCEKIGMAEELVNSNTKICANHFVYPNDFRADGNLKPYAAPAVNLPGGRRLEQSIMPIRTTRFQ